MFLREETMREALLEEILFELSPERDSHPRD